MKHSLAVLLLIVAASAVAARLPDTMTGVFHPAFKTLQVKPLSTSGMPVDAPAVISLNGNDRLLISFDELGEDRSYLRYELIHCDARWVPEGLVDSEFLDGFNQAEVEDYAFSRATLVHYVNYRIVVPNEQMKPLISGNYLLRVYPEDDPDLTLLQARFSVNEASAPISADVTSITDYDYNGSHQQLSLAVDTRRLNINDPFADLKVVVEQDGRTDNAVMVTRPLRVGSSIAYFEHNRDLTFDAGNEYRRFEVIADNYPGQHVESIIYADPFYHHTLYADEPRADGRYQYDLARKGYYRVRRQDAMDSDTDADYVVVHFSLATPRLPGYDIFIEGDLTDRRPGAGSLMVYNPETGCYEKALLLKQGAYSYQYVALPQDGKQGSHTAPVEGDYYQTQHDYTVRVYYRRPGERYDRLAAVAVVPTHKQ